MYNIYTSSDEIPTLYVSKSSIKLANRASEHNTYLTYVCLINDIQPNNNASNDNLHQETHESEDKLITVDRTKAFHELVDKNKDTDKNAGKENENNDDCDSPSPCTPMTSAEESEASENEAINLFVNDNPNILKLTKMKWLTEKSDGTSDTSSPVLSPTVSSTSSNYTTETEPEEKTMDEKYLTTILKLDKEHNLFGLSSITIVGAKPSKKNRKDEGPVFPQTAIVQVCCADECCRHKSKSDLPISLKCSRCGLRCNPYCSRCPPEPCRAPCVRTPPPPCPTSCHSVPKCSCRLSISPKPCFDPCSCFGMSITWKRKEPPPEPEPKILTPRSSCVLSKPLVARPCHHIPHCVPPSACFPYMMPCYWPSREGAPCTNPEQCFHKPPCRPPKNVPPPPPAPPAPPASAVITGEVAAAPQPVAPPPPQAPQAKSVVVKDASKKSSRAKKIKEDSKKKHRIPEPHGFIDTLQTDISIVNDIYQRRRNNF